MSKSARSKAEELFTASLKKDKQALKEKEKFQQERSQHVANLRALRLAKEASDREAAETAAAAKASAKKTPAKKPAKAE
jgi:hypothetical protein